MNDSILATDNSWDDIDPTNLSLTSREKVRAKIDGQVEEFLAKGGVIQQVEGFVSADTGVDWYPERSAKKGSFKGGRRMHTNSVG